MVHHESKEHLTVKTTSASESDWSEFFPNMIEAIREKTVPGVTKNLECSFSTTNEFSQVMSTAIIMNSFKKYFNYTRMGGICGIANIHMAGTL